MTNFLSAGALLARGPDGLTLAVERALWHLGFSDVRVIDGANDHGADILAVRQREQWVVQCKWSSRGPVDRSGVDDIERARTRYGADQAVIATNTSLNRPARDRLDALAGVGLNTFVWHGATLSKIWSQMPDQVPRKYKLRPYQEEAASAIERDLERSGRALLILATGLGKTVVSGEIIHRYLEKKRDAQVLVVAHMKELVDQLEKALWGHLNKATVTQTLHSDSRLSATLPLPGITIATIDSALTATKLGYAPDLIMIDETHHVGEFGMFSDLLDRCSGAPQFGVTATPWRGDKFDISDRFGPPSYTLGIAEGMTEGYLTKIDYRMFVDNLDWDFVRLASEHGYSIGELNRALFLPQRDDQIIDELRTAWQQTSNPRAILFCQTIDHAERIAQLLRTSDPAWQNAAFLHSGLTRQKRQILLNAFRMGRVPIITCVDVFNEGVDVPDVNLIGFLRVTHSRRIFVQQLGRGLRLREGKDSLKVLDFVTDIRRVAATLNLKRALGTLRQEELELPQGSSITFNDSTAGSLLDYWIKDAASLETAADEVRLNFPSPIGLD
ncbi:DEAD/DEAH box helicase family protein [Paenarthrobacter sp. YIM B13468]|uniref:DEAD/DEAH box helicase family protein n=1 Tax=Paenarthrobacter sp. YIM B13468 TaxID=3366295 RepID=UPI00366F23BF